MARTDNNSAVSPFDRSLCLRALGYSALLMGVACLVVLATDEPFSTPAMRAARLSAFAPAVAATGSALSIAQADSRGELRALAALGVPPIRRALGAAISGWVLGAAAVLVIASGYCDLSVLFPSVSAPHTWRVDAGLMIDDQSGVRVEPGGALTFFAPTTSAGSDFHPGRAPALFALAPLALGVPLWIAAPSSWRARLISALSCLGLAVVLLHAVAAGRLPAAVLLALPLPLALELWWGQARRR